MMGLLLFGVLFYLNFGALGRPGLWLGEGYDQFQPWVEDGLNVGGNRKRPLENEHVLQQPHSFTIPNYAQASSIENSEKRHKPCSINKYKLIIRQVTRLRKGQQALSYHSQNMISHCLEYLKSFKMIFQLCHLHQIVK
ncbi:hypothetical protein PGTUg99_014903 [Puccinia graminis f. sp. tritici]|uniref:Uncharacterized protein n=1 Tax=Puccinia graminis f. sp. tritici TaxID=56615 RepID=A0A5B0S614_PUCGR|nr:hypothetical protein PGTUg99_014903 [Puccinia graminis f. sp. tritici]